MGSAVGTDLPWILPERIRDNLAAYVSLDANFKINQTKPNQTKPNKKQAGTRTEEKDTGEENSIIMSVILYCSSLHQNPNKKHYLMTPVFIWERNFSIPGQILAPLEPKSYTGFKKKERKRKEKERNSEILKSFLSPKRANVFYLGRGSVSSESEWSIEVWPWGTAVDGSEGREGVK